MPADKLIDQILEAWRVHDGINRTLLDGIPDAGLKAVPLNSRGRTVAHQFAHMVRVRRAWLHYHRTGERVSPEKTPKDALPSRAKLRKDLETSGKETGDLLGKVLREGGKVKMFRGNPVRWMGYIIAHESHHRGSILLALKQNGIRIPGKVAMQGVWYAWMSGTPKNP